MWLTNNDDSETFWTYRDLALFLGLALPCLLVGVQFAKLTIGGLFPATTHKALLLLPGQFLGYLLLFTALAFLLKAEYGRPFWQSLGWRRPKVSLPSMAALGITLAFTIGILGALLRTPEVPSTMKDLLNDRISLILVSLFGVTFGPLCEELAFRGFMQPLFIRSFGVAPGIALSAVGFGLLHLPQYGYTWQHGILITLAGAAFGWIRWISGSTLGSTLMHSAYNLTLAVGALAAGSNVPQTW